jgi:hypothetical protein
VHLVQVIGRTDDDGVRPGSCQQILDVIVDIRHPESMGKSLGLREIRVAETHDLYTLELAEHDEVGHLGNGTRAENTYP